MFGQMSVKGNWSLVSPPCHIPDRWINEKGELSCRKRKQALPALFFVRNSCASGYQTACTQSRKDNGDILRNWSSVRNLAHKVSDFSENVMKEFHVGPDKGHIERSCRDIDVITFGNLCVDIVLNVPTLPPKSYKEKLAYMNDLARSSPEKKFWEAGGNSNFAIAAARLGMRCAALGHIGDEKYGKFLHEVLEKEGVQVVGLDEKNIKDETLVCWVLIDSEHRHGFCSRFDFNKDPAFKWMNELPKSAKDVIQRSKVVFFNGFVFDEITPDMIISAVEFANKTGCVVFFDPGPRAKSLFNGSACQKHALQKLLMYSDVLLLTAEEVTCLQYVQFLVLFI
ncbi:hypothetical protein KP509_12G091300 [Ceratopteris richardii]|uniref:Carbohydrate kinase PfkB domain-containing protein n=1 Tax=Ceratopteris richardii TaxID=49495 RepID=A0A8T2TLC0_CERRI|nr:hypothetical protein KP509_12G091300 [Ceratopteris richardii]